MSKNTMQTTGTLRIPELRYNFGIINWHQEGMQNRTEKQKNAWPI